MAEDRPDEGVAEATEQVAERDASAAHDAGPMPSPEEEQAAERYGEASSETTENYKEQVERGANQQGEGRTP
jgi:hypothetical protein